MRALFVVSDLFFSEPLGVMMLSAMCKRHGHQTRLSVLADARFARDLEEFDPDLVCYSVMTSHQYLFREADEVAREWMRRRGRAVPRVMGGPHATYFPAVLEQMDLDAICRGDGDYAIVAMLDALAAGGGLSGIPNVATPEQPEVEKQVVEFMDDLPHPDRDVLYEAAPDLQRVGIRSFQTMRGCPYKCTYCFNHAYNTFFKGEGRKLLRRRTVSDVIAEIKDVARRHPPLRMVRFGDDVFGVRLDDWLEEFADRYPKEVGIPFYCLQRASAMTEDMARLLSRAGCVSVGMSIEAGTERLRNEVLKRNMPDEMMREAFALARKYGLNAYANTILGIPGTTLEDDWQSYRFAKSLRAAAPTFGIFCPYPGTELTDYAIEKQELDPDYDFAELHHSGRSVLKQYTDEEREIQLRLQSLAPLFCKLPDAADPLLRLLVRLPLTKPYDAIGSLSISALLAWKCFPGAYPRSPRLLLDAVRRAFRMYAEPKAQEKREFRRRLAATAQTPALGVTSPDH